MRSFLTRVASDASCTADVAFNALSKTEADDSLPKLPDIDMRLVAALVPVWTRAKDCSHAEVMKAAQRLSSECMLASSLAHETLLPAYLPATADPSASETVARIEGKRIDRAKILSFLEHGLNETAVLYGHPGSLTELGAGDLSLLYSKLEAGGFSIVSQNSAEDLRSKAEYLGFSWISKHGREEGLQRYSHIRSLVLSDAGRAFESSKSETQSFGIAMLTELRTRLEGRRLTMEQVYGCSDEHLEGFAYSLTSECLVQWSLDRPWEVN